MTDFTTLTEADAANRLMRLAREIARIPSGAAITPEAGAHADRLLEEG